MSNTVFVLGAGFSADAKIPTQEKILDRLSYKLRRKKFYSNVKSFYKKAYNVNPRDLAKIPLEDAFTLLDRSILSTEAVCGFRMGEMLTDQSSLKKLIAMSLKEKLDIFASNKSFQDARNSYYSFFKILADKRIDNHANDPFSIVTLNWDTIPEHIISKIRKTEKNKKIEIDYTTYDYAYGKISQTPSIYLKIQNYYNIKIEKLHGSLNWVFCSSCGRLFVKKYDTDCPPIIYQNQDNKCSCCPEVPLKRLMITPTFIKDLNNTHLKMIWHNALMDIQESERLVFVVD
jgi:NAD-dependent SIR2 family protein deacetylase